MNITIEQWMMHDLGLSGNALIVFALINESGKGGTSMTKSDLAHATNTSTATCKRVLGMLSSRGLIRRSHVGHNEPSTWVSCVDARDFRTPTPIANVYGRNGRDRVMSIAN